MTKKKSTKRKILGVCTSSTVVLFALSRALEMREESSRERELTTVQGQLRHVGCYTPATWSDYNVIVTEALPAYRQHERHEDKKDIIFVIMLRVLPLQCRDHGCNFNQFQQFHFFDTTVVLVLYYYLGSSLVPLAHAVCIFRREYSRTY
jgi:hypothetical protein